MGAWRVSGCWWGGARGGIGMPGLSMSDLRSCNGPQLQTMALSLNATEVALEEASSDVSLDVLPAPSGGAEATAGAAAAAAEDDMAGQSVSGDAGRDAAGVMRGAGRRYQEDVGADAPVRSGTGRAYGLFLVTAAFAVFSTALVAIFVLVAAMPGTKRAAGTASSTAGTPSSAS